MATEVEYEGKKYLVPEGHIGEKIPCPICETEVIVKELCGKCGFAMDNAEAYNPELRLKSAQKYINALYEQRERQIGVLKETQNKLEIIVENGWKPTEIPDIF